MKKLDDIKFGQGHRTTIADHRRSRSRFCGWLVTAVLAVF